MCGTIGTNEMPDVDFDISPELAAAAVAAGLLDVVEENSESIVYEPTDKGLERLTTWLEAQTIHDCPSCEQPKIADEDYLCPQCRASSDKT